MTVLFSASPVSPASFARARMRRTVLGALGLFSVMLVGCAQSGTSAVAAPAAAKRVVEGSVSWRERIALPADAELQVSLNDVSRMDAPAIMLAEQRIRLQGRQAPITFRMEVDPSRIDPRMTYAVSARVEAGGQLFFINDTSYPVLTRGAGDRTDLTLVRVKR